MAVAMGSTRDREEGAHCKDNSSHDCVQSSQTRTPCLCCLESSDFLESFAMISLSRVKETPPQANDQQVHPHFQAVHKLGQAFIRVTNFVLRKDKCCEENGWIDYPSDEDHASIANCIFISVSF